MPRGERVPPGSGFVCVPSCCHNDTYRSPTASYVCRSPGAEATAPAAAATARGRHGDRPLRRPVVGEPRANA